MNVFPVKCYDSPTRFSAVDGTLRFRDKGAKQASKSQKKSVKSRHFISRQRLSKQVNRYLNLLFRDSTFRDSHTGYRSNFQFYCLPRQNWE